MATHTYGNQTVHLPDPDPEMVQACSVFHTPDSDSPYHMRLPRKKECPCCNQRKVLASLDKGGRKIGTTYGGWAKGASLPPAPYTLRWGERNTSTAAKRSDLAWEQEMGRKWDRPYSEQFAYTGSRKGDKELLAGLLVCEPMAVAA